MARKAYYQQIRFSRKISQLLILFAGINVMQKSEFIEERKLAALAKKCRMAAGKTRAAAARDMGIKHPSIHHAEESPEKGYHSLRVRLIETYSKLKVSGPFYRIEER